MRGRVQGGLGWAWVQGTQEREIACMHTSVTKYVSRTGISPRMTVRAKSRTLIRRKKPHGYTVIESTLL